LRAKDKPFLPEACGKAVESLKHLCASMLERKHGIHWTQLELAVQQIVDFYCGDERCESYLARGLERLDQLRAETALKAENPHELGRCLEVRSIIENAEMVMRASMERKESRRVPSRFMRVEYPDQDDRNYLCFLSQKRVDGKVVFSKIFLGQDNPK
jgi:succinate dehydrogenase/fumarate reductase flavoprotein subunit